MPIPNLYTRSIDTPRDRIVSIDIQLGHMEGKILEKTPGEKTFIRLLCEIGRLRAERDNIISKSIANRG